MGQEDSVTSDITVLGFESEFSFYSTLSYSTDNRCCYRSDDANLGPVLDGYPHAKERYRQARYDG